MNTPADLERWGKPDIFIWVHESELKAIQEWMAEHEKTCHRGDVEIMKFFGSGIGANTVIKCGCGATQDVTNYSLW